MDPKEGLEDRLDDLPLLPCLATTFRGSWIGVQGAVDGGPRGFHPRCQSLAEGAGRLAQFLGLLTQGTQRRNMRRLVGKPRPLDAQAQRLGTLHTNAARAVNLHVAKAWEPNRSWSSRLYTFARRATRPRRKSCQLSARSSAAAGFAITSGLTTDLYQCRNRSSSGVEAIRRNNALIVQLKTDARNV